MRLLVTRPEPDAEETAARLEAAGHEVIVQPLLDIVFSPPPDDLPAPAAIVTTSRNGVRALAAWPQAAGWRDKPLFVTGRATAQTASAAGFTDVRAGGADAAALIDLILAAKKGSGPILYAAARDRTSGLAAGLTALGLDVRIVEAYRAEPAARLDPAVVEAFRSASIDGVLFFSRRTAAAFAGLVEDAGLGDSFAGVVFYALSERIAEPLRGFAGAVIRVAESPDFDSLAALIAPPAGSKLA
jgi:uroporphyrinogen-III synthase